MSNDATIDYHQLLELSDKVHRNVASKPERDELIQQMYRLGKIDNRFYQDYQAGYNEEIIVETAVTIAAIILLGYMIDVTSSSTPLKETKIRTKRKKWHYARYPRYGARNFSRS